MKTEIRLTTGETFKNEGPEPVSAKIFYINAVGQYQNYIKTIDPGHSLTNTSLLTKVLINI